MAKRTVNCGDKEPDQKSFDKISEGEKLFNVVEVFDITNSPGKLTVDNDTVYAKCVVDIGDEEGRSLLHRLNLNDSAKGFFATRLFLKAIGEPYHGQIEIDTDKWIGRQFYGVVIHNGDFVNIKEFNFDKMINQESTPQPKEIKDLAWEE